MSNEDDNWAVKPLFARSPSERRELAETIPDALARHDALTGHIRHELHPSERAAFSTAMGEMLKREFGAFKVTVIYPDGQHFDVDYEPDRITT